MSLATDRREETREVPENIPGGTWELTHVRRPNALRLTAFLVNKNSGQRYVVSYNDGRLAYAREWKPPTTIPKYVDEFIRTKARQ